MRVFLLDLWLDLRAKRLAPIAIILLVAAIAVPIVLGKSDEAPPPAPATTASATPAGAPVISVQSDTVTTDSKLQTFSPRDPFQPTASAAAATSTTSDAGSTSSSGSSSSSSTSSSDATGGTTQEGTTSPSTGTGTSGGATTGTGPTTGTGNGSTGETTGQTKTTLFTYTVDLRFGQIDSVKSYKNVQRLRLIPNETDPQLVFLGVTTTGKTAVFLIDSNTGVETNGGKCRPSNDECTFLYLRPDGEHDQAVLTDSDGNTYHLRLSAIHRVTVSSANGNSNSGNSGSGNSGKQRSNAFTGSAGQPDDSTAPGGDTPPGEPNNRSSFQQFFADSGN